MRKIFSLWNIKTDGNVKCGKHLWQQAGMWIGKNFSRVENINSMLRNSQLERQHIVIFIKTLQRFNPHDYSRDLETTTESSSHEKTLQSHDHVHRNRYTNDSRKFHLCFRCYSFHLYINEFNFRLRKTFFIDLEKLLVFFFFFLKGKVPVCSCKGEIFLQSCMLRNQQLVSLAHSAIQLADLLFLLRKNFPFKEILFMHHRMHEKLFISGIETRCVQYYSAAFMKAYKNKQLFPRTSTIWINIRINIKT